MPKLICLALAASVALAGCGVFRSSETWSTVRAVRVDTRGEADPSAAYAARLSEQLNAANIEHQVVTYQFRYRSRLNEEAIATRTAVIYRDDVNPRYPWWLMDERLGQPFWLPSGDLAHQISFYIRTPVELVESASGARDGNGKTVAGAVQEDAKTARVPVANRGPAIALRTAPDRRERHAQVLSLPERKRAFLRARVAQENAPAAQGGAISAAHFRAVHGTSFDPLSAVDRRKAEQMRPRGRGVARAD